MKNYRAEQVTKAMLRDMHRGGRKFRKFKLNRRKFKAWLREEFLQRQQYWEEYTCQFIL